MQIVSNFDEFLHKMKFLSRTDTAIGIAKVLGIKQRTFHEMKKNNQIPFEETLKYCKDRQIDILWITNLQNK